MPEAGRDKLGPYIGEKKHHKKPVISTNTPSFRPKIK
jgi:hypothetical protein